YIYQAIFLEAWLACNKKESLNESNCYLLLLVSFLTAQAFMDDRPYTCADIAWVGGVASSANLKDMPILFKNISLEELDKLKTDFFESLLQNWFSPSRNLSEIYERYHNELLPPEYHLHLPPRPVSTAEKNEEDSIGTPASVVEEPHAAASFHI
ncbi:MAG TPA: hypothetical protein VLJ15_00795, partial [Gammaproteobacteria bacterium]|nr:hypothetical protein [Gammaproteobacteria bacterium]